MRINKIHQRRLYMIGLIAIGLAIAAGLILYALRQNINVFLTPSQLASTHYAPDYHLRLGGMVKKNSLVREQTGLAMHFVVTDLKHDITVHYNGILPDLFREGKGVIAEGYMNTSGTFTATQILAKHDENYMPRNIQKALT